MIKPGHLFKDDPNFKNKVERMGDVATELVDIFEISQSTQGIYILDQYIEAKVLIALDNNVRQDPAPWNKEVKTQDYLWASLLLEFAESMKAGEIKIISSDEAIPVCNNWLWSEHSENDEYPRLSGSIFKITDIPGERIKVGLTARYWRHNLGKRQYFPRDLHDRFIIIDDRGWHLGGSLNDISEKDLVVSEMDYDLVVECTARYNHIWDRCSRWNKNDK